MPSELSDIALRITCTLTGNGFLDIADTSRFCLFVVPPRTYLILTIPYCHYQNYTLCNMRMMCYSHVVIATSPTSVLLLRPWRLYQTLSGDLVHSCRPFICPTPSLMINAYFDRNDSEMSVRWIPVYMGTNCYYSLWQLYRRSTTVVAWIRPGFHYPSWRPELTAVDGPSTRLVETRARQHGPCWRVMETGHPSTRAVNSDHQLG